MIDCSGSSFNETVKFEHKYDVLTGQVCLCFLNEQQGSWEPTFFF